MKCLSVQKKVMEFAVAQSINHQFQCFEKLSECEQQACEGKVPRVYSCQTSVTVLKKSLSYHPYWLELLTKVNNEKNFHY